MSKLGHEIDYLELARKEGLLTPEYEEAVAQAKANAFLAIWKDIVKEPKRLQEILSNLQPEEREQMLKLLEMQTKKEKAE